MPSSPQDVRRNWRVPVTRLVMVDLVVGVQEETGFLVAAAWTFEAPHWMQAAPRGS